MTNMNRSEKGFFKGFLIAMFSTLFWIGVTILIVVNLNGCAAQTAAPQELTEADYATGLVQCEAGAPDLGFDGCDQPVAISPANPVATVCHCIGGSYGCFGHPGQPTCEESKR